MLKTYFYFLGVLVVFGLKPNFKYKNHHLSTELALTQVVFELFDHRNVTNLHVIQFGKNHLCNENIKNVFEAHKGSLKLITRNTYMNIDSSTVVFVESIKDLKAFMKITLFKNPRTLNVLIFMKDLKNELNSSEIFIQSPPQASNGHVVHFTYFLIEEKHQISLKTFEWWTPQKCGTVQFVTINTFKKTNLKWTQSPLKIPEKFTNFHNCTITHHSTFFASPTLELLASMGELGKMFHEGVPAMLERQESIEVRLREIFAKIGNFTSLGGIQNRYLSTIGQYVNWGGETECSMACNQNPFVAMHSPPAPYTNYEKMLMPFDKIVWIGLSIIFSSSFAIIFGIGRLPNTIKYLFYNKKHQSPMFNVINILFGNAQTHLPIESFGRIILIYFVFFCLVVRTAYQGSFKIIKKNSFLN